MTRRANPNTIQDKVLVGYQGWFTCAGDGEPIGPGHHGWLHWFNQPIPSGGRPNTDIWPDISDYDPSELYVAPGLKTTSGDPVYLFSSRHPRTVRRHFHWMAQHGVDGAFLQRFAGQCEIKQGNLGILNLRDEVGDRVREAAEAEDRVYAIMYDVSGVSPDKIQNILEQDWIHLLRDKHLLDSPNYLRDNGRPVIALWGFGFNGRHHTPELVRAIAAFFRDYTPGGVYLVAGTPGHWRTSNSDADRNTGFVQVWTECFDAICPWTVGRYGNEEEADRWGQERVKADAEYLRKIETEGGKRVDYIPVVLPGGSGFNLSEGKWGMNDIRRNGGRFLWRQIYNARRAGVRTIYGAMWDEYDEGTAFMPVVSYSSQLPAHPSFRFVALDVDGHDLPSDWYMRIMGFAAEGFHGERTLLDTFPVKELQDYWSTRPRREDANGSGSRGEGQGQADVDAVTRALREWEVSEGHVDAADAPPPYSLEDTRVAQAQWVQQHPSAQAGRTGPPVRQDTRPSPSPGHGHSSTSMSMSAAVPLGAAAIAHTLSASSSPSPGPGMMPRPTPPPVNISSRPGHPPTPPTRPPYHLAESGKCAGKTPPPLAPQRPPDRTQVGYDLDAGRQQSYHAGHVPSIGHGRPSATSSPGGALAFPAPAGPHVGEYARGRSRSRSRSRSKSRSSSRSRLRKHKQHNHHHGHSHNHSPALPGQAHGHTHSLSPVGSMPAMAFPGAGLGVGTGSYDAYSSGGQGQGQGHTPVHSHPVGYGSGYSHGQQGYAQPTYSQGSGQQGYVQGQGQQGYIQGPGYAQGQGSQGPYSGPYPSPAHQHQGGYDTPGYGYGQGYDAMTQQQGYGYTSHPSSGYYPPYAPGTGSSTSAPYPSGSNGGGGGGGGLPGGIASALQAVEGIAGRQTRQQLEKTVNSLAKSGLFNKLK